MDIVAGGGKYGSYAAEFLRKQGRSYVVVDRDSNCLAAKEFALQSVAIPELKGEYFIEGNLETILGLLNSLEVEYVFPTVPTHFAADLAQIKFNLRTWAEGIDSIIPKMPQTAIVKGEKGKLIATFNKNQKCIDRCNMPEICPSSGFRKPCTMTELMRIAAPQGFFLLSYSLAPGLGALKASELLQFFEWAERKERFVVATTCDCHGVLSALRTSTI